MCKVQRLGFEVEIFLSPRLRTSIKKVDIAFSDVYFA